MNIEAIACHLYRDTKALRQNDNQIMMAYLKKIDNAFFRRIYAYNLNSFNNMLSQFNQDEILIINNELLNLLSIKRYIENNPNSKIIILYFIWDEYYRIAALDNASQQDFVNKFKEIVFAFEAIK